LGPATATRKFQKIAQETQAARLALRKSRQICIVSVAQGDANVLQFDLAAFAQWAFFKFYKFVKLLQI